MSIQAKLLEMKRLMIEKKKIGGSQVAELPRNDSTPEPAADPRREDQKIVLSAESAPAEPPAEPQEAEPQEKVAQQQPSRQSSPAEELEEGEAVEERASNPTIPPPPAEPAPESKPLPHPVLNPERGSDNLELVQANCISYSMEEDVRHVLGAVQEKEKWREESKTEKKERKIVLKELTKIKECIRNLQGVVKGLEYIESRVKHNPAMRTTIRNCLKEMSALANA